MHSERALSRALAGTGTAVDFTGVWVNELKSEATLTQKQDVISGDYKSAVSDDGTQATGKLSGFADGDLISFVVHWDKFQAITAWVGQLEAGGKSLKTLWQMTKQVADGDEWASINAGADYFTKK